VSDQVPVDFTVGSVVAGYRLEERIGQGGMAMVFRAHDSRLDRQVALKILAPRLATDDAFRQRFIRESRAAAAVDDPHIIPVFEAGESDGVLFIAMRYVRGGDVRSLIDRTGPLPAHRVAELIAQTASALDAAHARGLVHRDVKPANMLLDTRTVAGRPDHVYLSDFGLSKTALAATSLTASGEFLGTLDYVAPEQIEGQRQLDGRSDLYALACSAYEMLGGEPPFRRDQGVSVMYAHLSEAPPLVRARRPELPAAVDAVLSRALAKAPEDRYPTCRDFAAALQQALGLGPSATDAGTDEAALSLAAADQARTAAAASSAAAGTPGEREPTQPQTDRLTAPGSAEPGLARAGSATAGLAAAGPAEVGLAGAGSASGTGATSAWSPERQQQRRRWWRSPAPVAGLCVLALAAAGGGYALAGRGHHGGARTASTEPTAPGCTATSAMATARASNLTRVQTRRATTGGSPFGVFVAPGGQYYLVTIGNAVAVLRSGAGLSTSLVRTIQAAGADEGAAFTPGGRFLVAAGGSGATVIDVADAEDGAPGADAGKLTSHGSGAAEVYVTPDGRYAFVSLQTSNELAVFNLRSALADGFSAADLVGYVPVPAGPVGMTSDGTWLYVASLSGKLSVVSLARAEHNEPDPVVSTVPAGCGSVRALISRSHQVIWVTDSRADALLAFSVPKLRTDRAHALLAKVMVGATPVGETFVDGGSTILVADANLGGPSGAGPTVAVVSAGSAPDGGPSLLGYLPVGSGPTQFAVTAGGKTVLLTLEGAHQLEAVAVRTLH